MANIRVIIEGVKFSGKSTLANELKQINRNANFIEYRGSCLKTSKRYTIHPNFGLRLKSLAIFFHQLNDESVIMIRGHLFPFAIAKATGQSLEDISFQEIDHSFMDSSVSLVLLTVSRDIFFERIKLRELEGRKTDQWDQSWENTLRVQEAYMNYFSKSSVKKILIEPTMSSARDICKIILNRIGMLAAPMNQL